MASNALHPLITLLALSSLVLFIRLPATNARYLQELPSLEDALQLPTLEDALQSMKGLKGRESEKADLEMLHEFIHRRMDLEINRDYPGSGANNRHTPNPPVKD